MTDVMRKYVLTTRCSRCSQPLIGYMIYIQTCSLIQLTRVPRNKPAAGKVDVQNFTLTLRRLVHRNLFSLIIFPVRNNRRTPNIISIQQVRRYNIITEHNLNSMGAQLVVVNANG